MNNRAYPSMTALLGLLAIAGYQNRDKIAEFLRGHANAPGGQGQGQGQPGTQAQAQPQITPQGSLGGLLGGLGGAGAGGLLSGGLGELVDRFRQAGQGDVADSWVSTGPNKEIAPPQLEQAIGPDVLDHLSQQTGLSREDILSRLSRDLPKAVDEFTPQGRVPTASEIS